MCTVPWLAAGEISAPVRVNVPVRVLTRIRPTLPPPAPPMLRLVRDVEHDREREAREEHALERQAELDPAMVDADEATVRQTTIDLLDFGCKSESDRLSTAFTVVTRLRFRFLDGVVVDENRAGHRPRAARCNRMTASSIDTSVA